MTAVTYPSIGPVQRHPHEGHRPCILGSVQESAGFWALVLRRNRDASLEHGLRMLVEAGNLENFRRLAGMSSAGHGHEDAADGDVRNFVDSDVYKWLEAVAWASDQGDVPPSVMRGADEAIALIVAAQDDDGYLNTWYQTGDRAMRFSNMQFGHELYCLGHLIQAAVAWHRVRADDRLLTVATAFADLAVETFGPGGRDEVCGHPEIETALVELSRVTGNAAYLVLARLFVHRRGYGRLGAGRFGSAYYQDRVPLEDTEVPEGHAVRALYLEAGAVDVAVAVGDADGIEASLRRCERLLATRTHLTGGVGSRYHGESIGDDFELTPDRAYCETCAGIAFVMWAWRLLLVHPQAWLADALERALFNAVLAGVSADGREFQYENPLHVRDVHPRKPWFEIACCPPNLMRLLAALQHYAVTVGGEGELYVHQFVAGTIADGERRLSISTGYPASPTVTLTIGSAWQGVLALRRPQWSRDTEITVNGVAIDPVDVDGYARIDRQWSPGDVVRMSIEMSPAFVVPHPNIDSVRGCLAVMRGPLVYCVEQHSLPPGVSLSRLRVDPSRPLVDLDSNSVPTVSVPVRVSRHEDSMSLYERGEATPAVLGDPLCVTAIPFMSWGNGEPGAMRVWLPALLDA